MICKQHFFFSCWARKNMRQSRRKNLEAAASRRGDRFGHVGVGSVGNAFADVAARDGRLRPVLEGTVVRDGARTHDMQLEDVRLQGQQGQHASQHPAGGGFLPCAEPADALAGGVARSACCSAGIRAHKVAARFGCARWDQTVIMAYT